MKSIRRRQINSALESVDSPTGASIPPRKGLRTLQVVSNQSQQNGSLTRPLTRQESLQQQKSLDELKKNKNNSSIDGLKKSASVDENLKQMKRKTTTKTTTTTTITSDKVQTRKRLVRQKNVSEANDQNVEQVVKPTQQLKRKLKKQISQVDKLSKEQLPKSQDSVRPVVTRKAKSVKQSTIGDKSIDQITKERVIGWLTSDDPISDPDYWQLMALEAKHQLRLLQEKSQQEQERLLQELEEQKLENELLMEENRQMRQLIAKANSLQDVLEDLLAD